MPVRGFDQGVNGYWAQFFQTLADQKKAELKKIKIVGDQSKFWEGRSDRQLKMQEQRDNLDEG